MKYVFASFFFFGGGGGGGGGGGVRRGGGGGGGGGGVTVRVMEYIIRVPSIFFGINAHTRYPCFSVRDFSITND